MFQKIKNVLWTVFILIGAFGCGGKDHATSANQGSVDDLSFLMASHPELKTASLKQIKTAGSKEASSTKAVHRLQRPGGPNDAFALTSVIHETESASNSGKDGENPEVKQPDNATGSSDAKKNDDDNASASSKTSELDPELAKKAQALIDKILDDFDFKAQVELGFKVLGIAINMENKMFEEHKNLKSSGKLGMKDDKFGSKDIKGRGGNMHKQERGMDPGSAQYNDIFEQMDFGDVERLNGDMVETGSMTTESIMQAEKFGSNFAHSSKDSDSSIDDKFDDEYAQKKITCEEFVNNPFIKIAEKEVERVIRANKKEIKASISGCAKILGGQFLQCVDDFNKLVKLVNETATCSMEDFEELEKTLKEKTDGKFEELDESVRDCMAIQFAKCGFKEESLKQSRNQSNRSEPKPNDAGEAHTTTGTRGRINDAEVGN